MHGMDIALVVNAQRDGKGAGHDLEGLARVGTQGLRGLLVHEPCEHELAPDVLNNHRKDKGNAKGLNFNRLKFVEEAIWPCLGNSDLRVVQTGLIKTNFVDIFVYLFSILIIFLFLCFLFLVI